MWWRKIILLLCVCAFALPSNSQNRVRGYNHIGYDIIAGDTIPNIYILPITKSTRRRKKDLRRYAKLVRAVKKVYPYAKEAKREMELMEVELAEIPTKKGQKEYIKSIQKRITKKYTPVLKHMTIFEGKVLLKLIDRETDYTAYEIVREFRGGFVAGFWQMFARMFGNNLKLNYQPEKRDRLLDQIVTAYERGEL